MYQCPLSVFHHHHIYHLPSFLSFRPFTMEDWAIDFQAHDLDLLGQDFLDLLSQPVEHFVFNYSTEEYFSRSDDWFEFQDLVCMSPTENATDFNVSVTTANGTGSETSDLLKDCGVNIESEPSFASGELSQMHDLNAQETRKFEDCLSEFAVAQANDKTTRRRKRFSNERRKEVDHIRKAGACIRCRLMKTAVSISENFPDFERYSL
jgi:hypothetical protein